MSCTLTSSAQVQTLLMKVMRAASGYPELKPKTDFGDPPLGLSPQARSLFYFPVRDAIEAHGCMLKKFSPNICANSDTPQDIIDAVVSDLGLDS